MLPAQLYKAIIEEEKKGVSPVNLKRAAKNVAETYNQKALKSGCTFLDYSKPQNRCAYLYKYATVHTRLVSKCFRKFMKKKAVKKILHKKSDIRICCLGGGPGTDVVGVFKALSVIPRMQQKISDATILDLSLGWHHSFNLIIQNLINGNLKDIPKTYVREDFKANFLEVNLLKPLPANVVEAVSKADIICMVKFVSAVLGNKDSVKALKILADLFKIGTIVLFIDNFQGKVSQSIQDLSKLAGLQIVLGPDVEAIHIETEVIPNTFGCKPMKNARVTVIGLVKVSKLKVKNDVFIGEDSDEGWNTESEESDLVSCTSNELNKGKANKSTQTNYFPDLIELDRLVNALSELVAVMLKYKEECSSCKCCVN